MFLGASFALAQTSSSQPASSQDQSAEAAHVLALDNSWNRAIETNDVRAMDLLLADGFVSIDYDGSIQTKGEFLASLRTPGYQGPSQSVTEQSKAEVYADSAIVYGVYRTKSAEKGKTVVRRERFLDTWVNVNHTWKCVASVTVLIPGK